MKDGNKPDKLSVPSPEEMLTRFQEKRDAGRKRAPHAPAGGSGLVGSSATSALSPIHGRSAQHPKHQGPSHGA